MKQDVYLQIPGSSLEDEECPPSPNDFSSLAIKAFEIVSMLPDVHEYMNGSYVGKDLTILPMVFDILKVLQREVMLSYVLLIINENVKSAGKKQQANIQIAESQAALKKE